MPTYNSGKHLRESIDSILGQTYQNLELLITDDHSSEEETLSILREYAEKDKRVDVLFLDSNEGPGFSRNKSIERAKGRYIAFCDSDDRWFPEKLERQVAFMQEKHCVLAYSSYITIDENDNETGLIIAPHAIEFDRLKRDNKIGCLTAIYDRKQLGKKYFMPFIRKRQVWGLFLTILRDSGSAAYAIQKPMAYYRQRSDSLSSDKLSLVKYNVQVYETVLGFPHWKAYLYFLFVFLPNYFAKVFKSKCDSRRYLRSKKN